jgi:hypothetical protein
MSCKKGAAAVCNCASKTGNWGVGTTTQANATLVTTEQDILHNAAFVSSATINVAGTATAALLVLTTAHVQVATRLLALGAPGWVWGAAVGVEGKAGGWLPRRALWTFALGYAAVGGFLHATWYPWT